MAWNCWVWLRLCKLGKKFMISLSRCKRGTSLYYRLVDNDYKSSWGALGPRGRGANQRVGQVPRDGQTKELWPELKQGTECVWASIRSCPIPEIVFIIAKHLRRPKHDIEDATLDWGEKGGEGVKGHLRDQRMR